MYYSNYSIIEYIPSSVGITLGNVSTSNLLSLITQTCRYTSSVAESIASDIKNTGFCLNIFKKYYKSEFKYLNYI